MPRINEKRFDYAAEDAIRALYGELKAEGISDAEVGAWLNCSGQNVGRHFREASFSFRQYVIIRGRLDEIKEARQRSRFDEIRKATRRIKGEDDRPAAVILIDRINESVSVATSPENRSEEARAERRSRVL